MLFQLALDHDVMMGLGSWNGNGSIFVVPEHRGSRIVVDQLILDGRNEGQRVLRIEVLLLDRTNG
jgi:hypothetical protein